MLLHPHWVDDFDHSYRFIVNVRLNTPHYLATAMMGLSGSGLLPIPMVEVMPSQASSKGYHMKQFVVIRHVCVNMSRRRFLSNGPTMLTCF